MHDGAAALLIVLVSAKKLANIKAAKAVADIVRTTLGPKSMLKMLLDPMGGIVMTNDGNSILREVDVSHPAAKSMIELSRAQEEEVGDGTTSVCVIAGALLNACQSLLEKGIHPTQISESFMAALQKSDEILQGVSRPVDLSAREDLIHTIDTCLSSKVVSQNSEIISPICVDSVLSIIDAATATNVDLNDVKIVKQVGGTIDDTELVHGLVFDKGAKKTAGGPGRIENAKILLANTSMDADKIKVYGSRVRVDSMGFRCEPTCEGRWHAGRAPTRNALHLPVLSVLRAPLKSPHRARYHRCAGSRRSRPMKAGVGCVDCWCLPTTITPRASGRRAGLS